MANEPADQKPSETALFAALRRTLAHKAYADEKFGPDNMAEIFLPAHFRFFLKFQKIRMNTRDNLNAALPGLTEYMIARTANFDRLFVDALDHEIPQIVLLGAGYDTRAYRFAKRNHGTQIFELDMPPTQSRKKSCLKAARIEVPQQVKLTPIDFNEESLVDVLQEAGYRNQEKTLFLWEGVTYYLDPESIVATLEFVRHNAHDESAIAFDYTIPLTEENIDAYYGAKEFAQTMKDHHGDEALLFSIDEDGLDAFLEQRGLKIVDHMRNDEIERAFLMQDDGSLIGRMTGHFRFVLASKK